MDEEKQSNIPKKDDQIISSQIVDGDVAKATEGKRSEKENIKKSDNNFSCIFFKLMRKLLYLVVWVFLIFNIFGIDLYNKFVAQFLPDYVNEFVVNNRIYLYLILIILLLLIARIKRILYWFFGFLFLPFYILLIFIPKTTFRGLNNSLKIILGNYKFTKTISYRISSLLILILSIIIIFDKSNKQLISVAIIILLIKLFAHYIKRFRLVLKPIAIIEILRKAVEANWVDNFIKNSSLAEFKKMGKDDENYSKKMMESLGIMWVINRVFYRFANYLKKSENNRFITIYFIWLITTTFIRTVLFFALIFYALQKVYIDSFVSQININFYNSLYFSFTNILGATFGDIVPNSTIARTLVSLEILSSIIIGLILFFIFTTIVLEKYKRDIEEISEKLYQEGEDVKLLITREIGKGAKNLGQLINDYFIHAKVKKGKYLNFLKPDEEERIDGMNDIEILDYKNNSNNKEV